MNEIVASSSMSQSRIHVLIQRLIVGQGKKERSDFQGKKNAVIKRAREEAGQLSREVLASVYVVLLYGRLRF